MLFQRSLIGNSRTAQDQWAEVRAFRRAYALNEQRHAELMRAAGLHVNMGLIPQDVYQEFDNTTVEVFRSDNGDSFLNPLLGRSRSISIGKLVHKFRRASDAGIAQVSMTGQIGIKFDQVEYSYDGTIVPIFDTGFYRNFREWEGMTSEGFDALIDDQREHMVTLREKYVDSFLDGHVDRDGNYITVDALSWKGMRNDTRVAQIELGATGVNFDFTDTAQTYAAIEAAFKVVRDVMWITNNSERPLDIYVSREIGSNFERTSSESYASRKVIERLTGLMGINSIQTSSKLSGNEFFGLPTESDKVRPIVGMGINTVPNPRPLFNSNYEFIMWGACGWEVKTDFAGRYCAFMAHVIA